MGWTESHRGSIALSRGEWHMTHPGTVGGKAGSDEAIGKEQP